MMQESKMVYKIFPFLLWFDAGPKAVDDPTIIVRVEEGMQALSNLPEWYSYLLYIAVSASFGIRGADKIMNMRSKK